MESSFNFELILVSLTLISALIIVIYWFLRRGKADVPRDKQPLLVDYAKSFFPVLFIVVVLRSFVAEPFRIPSGSMIPTLEIGDFILVKKYSYGVRLPVLHTKIFDVGEPKRGDVVVFRYPPKPEVNFIKRVIGLPGDEVVWTKDKKLIINGEPAKYQPDGQHETRNSFGQVTPVQQLKETLPGDEPHDLILFPRPSMRVGTYTVPKGHYFMMGDNRDNSSDSRFWGTVPQENLVGQASFVWMHWNWLTGGDGFQGARIGTSVN